MAEIAGLKLIVPSSVAGSGVSLSGAKVTFTAAASVSVNGVFGGTFDNYCIVYRAVGVGGSSSQSVRLRSSGTDDSTSNYYRQYLEANGVSVNGGRQGPSSTWSNPFYTSFSTEYSGTTAYIYGPYLAQPTAMRGVNVSGDSGAYILDSAYTHNVSSAFDGFTIYTTNDSITGALTVYGLSQ